MVEEMSINQVTDFVRRFTGELRAVGRGGSLMDSLREMIWLKNIGRSENS